VKLVGFVRVSRITAATSERSNVRRFLAWAESANDEERVDAAVILARTHFAAALRGELQRDLEICLAIIAEDRSSLVRRALAEAVADAASAPRPVILALAGDEPEIASIVLTRSPLLSEGELVEYAVRGEARLQLALARRPGLPPRVAAILAEAGQRDVVIALAKNEQASLAANTLRRIADRFVDDEDVRTALLARHELPSILRFDLIETMSKARAADDGFKVAPARRERMTREASERSAIEVASACEPGEVRDLVRHLRVQGALTAALLMRALISGGRTFFAAAASELSGVAAERVEGLVHDPHGAGFSALYRRMGLPRCFLAAFPRLTQLTNLAAKAPIEPRNPLFHGLSRRVSGSHGQSLAGSSRFCVAWRRRRPWRMRACLLRLPPRS